MMTVCTFIAFHNWFLRQYRKTKCCKGLEPQNFIGWCRCLICGLKSVDWVGISFMKPMQAEV